MRTSLSPYPWQHLETVSALLARTASQVRPYVARAIRRDRIVEALAATLAGDVTTLVERVSPRQAPRPDDRTVYVSIAGALTVSVTVERDLAAAAIARRLGRSTPLSSPDTPLDAPLSGALAALVVDAVRRAARGPVTLTAPPEPETHGVSADATVFVDDRAYATTVWAAAAAAPAPPEPSTALLERLDGLPLTLSLVAAKSAMRLRDLGGWQAGDVWLPGDDWTVESSAAPNGAGRLVGRVALVGAASERGVWVECSSEGRLVLTREVASLSADADDAARPGDQSKMEDNDTTRADGTDPAESNDLADAVLDVPIVVRVEVGTVALAARDWAALGKGDVLETGVRLGEPVILRVAGQAVARGELVNVDGELGVRIVEMLRAGSTG